MSGDWASARVSASSTSTAVGCSQWRSTCTARSPCRGASHPLAQPSGRDCAKCSASRRLPTPGTPVSNFTGWS
jgi:hypothetical protein